MPTPTGRPASGCEQASRCIPPLTSAEGSEIYRYAPWFAWLAVPWTFLPEWLAGVLWSAVLLGASALALLPLVRLRAWILVAFFAPILVGISAVGNVQPLIVAALVLGVERRSGPLWIALAASLKIFPILLALVYAGRRQWWAFAATVAITALLWLPAVFLYDLSAYPVSAGRGGSPHRLPDPLLRGRGHRHGRHLRPGADALGLAGTGATAVVVSLPRLFVYDVTYLMLGVEAGGSRPDSPDALGRGSDQRFQDRAGGCGLGPVQPEGQTGQAIFAWLDRAEIEPFEDRDAGAHQDAVRLRVVAEALDGEVIGPDQAEPVAGNPARALDGEAHEVLAEVLARLQEAGVPRPHQQPLGAFWDAGGRELIGSHRIGVTKVDHHGRPDEGLQRHRLDRVPALDVVQRRLDMRPGVEIQVESGHGEVVAPLEGKRSLDAETGAARPCRQAAGKWDGDVNQSGHRRSR